MPQSPQQSTFLIYKPVNNRNNINTNGNDNNNEQKHISLRAPGDCTNDHFEVDNDHKAEATASYNFNEPCSGDSIAYDLYNQTTQHQQQKSILEQLDQRQRHRNHIYENTKFDLRFSQKLLLQKLFPNRENNNVIYENLCRGCGYGVFESHGKLCNFCACIVNGLKSRQVRESVESKRILVDTGENIYENICGKCSALYNTDECESCEANTVQDGSCVSETRTEFSHFGLAAADVIKVTKSKSFQKRDKRSLFHGLFGSLKRSVKTSQASRKHLDIIHNVDGFDNVFCTQETFDLERICDLKRSQSSDQPIYGRLKHNEPNNRNICISTQTLPPKLEHSQSHEKLFHISSENKVENVTICKTSPTPTFASKYGFSRKRPRISKPRLLCSLPHKTVALKIAELHQSQPLTKLSLYLSDSVCHWMTLLRQQVHKYYSFGVPVDDENYGLCVPKNIPPKTASINYPNEISIDIHDILDSETIINGEEVITEYNTFYETAFNDVRKLDEFNCSIDEYNESTLLQMVNSFKYKLMTKRMQHQNDQKQQRSYQQKEEQQPAIAALSTEFAPTTTVPASWLPYLPEQQVKRQTIQTAFDSNVGSNRPSEHSVTPATTAHLLLPAGGEQGCSSCCTDCHVIAALKNYSEAHEYGSECVNYIQCTSCSSQLSYGSQFRFEKDWQIINTGTCDKRQDRSDTKVNNTTENVTACSEVSNGENFNNNFVPIIFVANQENNNNTTITTICPVAGIQNNNSQLDKVASTVATFDIHQIVRSTLLSNCLNKIVIYYDKQLILFLRKKHCAQYINRGHDQLVRKYERFCARIKRVFVKQRGETGVKVLTVHGGGGGGGGDSVSVDVTSNNTSSALNESVTGALALETALTGRSLRKADNFDARGSDKPRAQIVVKRLTLSDSLKEFSDDENDNADLIKKREGEIDQNSYTKMKANDEVVLRPKSKEHVERSRKAQGTFLDSANGASFPEWSHEKANEKCNVLEENQFIGFGESKQSVTPIHHQISEIADTTATPIQAASAKCKEHVEKEEDIYQPIWKFKTVGEAKESYQTDADYYGGSGVVTFTANAPTSISSQPYDSSSMRLTNALVEECAEDHGEWETDDEFSFTRQFGKEESDGADTALSSSTADISSMGQSLLSAVSGSTAGSTILGFESSTATLASAMSSSLQHSILRSIGIFYSLTEPKLRAIIYDYDRSKASLYFTKNHTSLLQKYSKGLSASQNPIKFADSCIDKSVKVPLPLPTLAHNESNSAANSAVQKTQFLPDSVQAWKFMLLGVYYSEDEEDMIIAESEILRAQEFRESTDAPTQHSEQQLHVLQRFKSASFGNLVDLPIEDDKKSIAERMRNKLQRGVFKLNMRSPKSEKKSRAIFRRMETGSLYLEEGMKPKYPIFGAPLEQLEMDGATHPHVSRFVVDCIAYIEQKDCILQDGLYRASGNKVAIDDLKQKLSESYIYDSRLLVADDIHTLTSLLKQFFRELPEPLIPQHTYERFGRKLADTTAIEQIREAFEDMREPNHSTLKYLIRHLKNVAAYSVENRMPASNLAIVWGPCIFSANQVEFVDIGRMNTLAKVLIENYELIFSESERLVS